MDDKTKKEVVGILDTLKNKNEDGKEENKKISEEDRQEFKDFILQAIRGMYLGIFLRWNSLETDPSILRGALAQYCNNCYQSLIRGDDEYVMEVFSRIPSHSPICLFHMIFGLGDFIFNVLEDVVKTKNMIAKHGADNLRTTIGTMIEAHLAPLDLELYLDHKCSGQKLSELASENPNGVIFRTTTTTFDQ